MVTKEQIKKWNIEFTQATPEQQRVLIAKDVITQIKEHKYNAKRKTYIKILNDDRFLPSDQVQEYIDDITCNCCALGSMLMSCIKYQNNVTFSDVIDIPIEKHNILNIFDNKQKILIEVAFEGWSIDCDDEDNNDNEDYYTFSDGIYVDESLSSYNVSVDEYNYAGDFCRKQLSDEDKLLKIMNNIIKNNGTFKP